MTPRSLLLSLAVAGAAFAVADGDGAAIADFSFELFRDDRITVSIPRDWNATRTPGGSVLRLTPPDARGENVAELSVQLVTADEARKLERLAADSVRAWLSLVSERPLAVVSDRTFARFALEAVTGRALRWGSRLVWLEGGDPPRRAAFRVDTPAEHGLGAVAWLHADATVDVAVCRAWLDHAAESARGPERDHS